MSDIDASVRRGIAAAQAGELAEARRLLGQAVIAQPGHEQAWLWLATAVDDVEQRRYCLRRVLHLDPANDEARRRLLALDSARTLQEKEQPLDAARVHEFPCLNCGSNRRYDAERGGLVCPYCGAEAGIAREAPPAAHDAVDAFLAPEAVTWLGEQVYRCQNCAGTVRFSARMGSLECPFCGSTFLVAPRTAVSPTHPQSILPFRLDRDGAEAALRRWMRKGAWTPAALPGQATIEQLHGVYVPFWLFGGYVLGDSTHSVQAPADPMINWSFSNAPVCAALSLTDKMARGLEPFDFEELVAYQPDYLAGWPVEVAQIEAFASAGQALRRMEWAAAGDRAKVKQARFVDSCSLALLPVFLGAYRYHGRLYSFAVNGQTGRVGGQGPRSADKVLKAVLILGVVGLVTAAAAGLGYSFIKPDRADAGRAGELVTWGVILFFWLMLTFFGGLWLVAVRSRRP